jgi:hypothetical protein
VYHSIVNRWTFYCKWGLGLLVPSSFSCFSEWRVHLLWSVIFRDFQGGMDQAPLPLPELHL